MLRQFITGFGINARYSRLWLASAISNLGDGMLETAGPLLAASLTRDPAIVAGVATATTLPWLLFALLSGALADRWNRKYAMVGADIFRGLVMLVLAVAVFGGWTTIWLLYVVAFLLGTAQTLFDTSAMSLLPALVDGPDLEKANSRLYATELVTNSFAGKPLGGLLFAAAVALPFFFDGLSFLLGAALVLTISGSFHPRNSTDTSSRERRGNLWSDIVEGLRWLAGHRILRTLAMMTGLSNLASSAVFAIAVLFAQEKLGLGDVGFGLLLTVGAVGGLVGSLIVTQTVKRLGPGTALQTCMLIGAFTYAGIALTNSPYVVGGIFLVTTITSVIWNVVTVSFRQRIIPNELLGRVNSVYRLLAWGSLPLGALVGGFVARSYGLSAPMWLAAALQLIIFLATIGTINNSSLVGAQQSTIQGAQQNVQ